VERQWIQGERDSAALEAVGRAVLHDAPAVSPDYFALVTPDTLEPAVSAEPGTIVIVAARVGRTRLIDNLILGQATEIDARRGRTA
jgi:pantothenate synthetase